MATLAGQKTETTNRIYIMMKHKVIGRAQNMTVNTDFGAERVYEIGNYMSPEIVYLKYTGSLNLERFRTIIDDLADDSMGITAMGEEILKRDVLDTNITDSITSKVVATYRGCSALTTDYSYQANSITSESLSMGFLSASNGHN
jgi:hypothetical protein